LRPGRCRVRILAGAGDFSLKILQTGGYLTGISDHSTLFSAELENERSYTSSPPVCLHGMERGDHNFFLPVYKGYFMA